MLILTSPRRVPAPGAGGSPPTISGISPSSGSTAGGDSVTITGTNLGSATDVTFGGVSGTITANSSTSITVTTPAGSAGACDVVVTCAAGSVTSTGGYTYNSGGASANILNAASFETNFDGFKNWSGGTPTGVSRDTGQHHGTGTTSVKRTLPVGGSSPGEMAFDMGDQDRIWCQFWMYITAAFDGTHKFNIHENISAGSQFGGLYMIDGNLKWPFIGWGGPCGTGHAAEWNSQSAVVRSLTGFTGAWHKIEYEYWRNGHPSGYPAVKIWIDGTMITSYSGIPSPGSYSNGYLICGERQCSEPLRHFQFFGVHNSSPATTVAADVYVDEVSISSIGRIGT